MSTDCGHYRNQIPRAMLGDLESDELQRLNAHIAECGECKLEEQLYANTLDLLHSVCDSPVPKHFFVYGQARRESPWASFRNMSLAWQGIAASLILAVTVLGSLTAAKSQVRFESGAMIISFGGAAALKSASQPAPGVDTQALEAKILRLAEERSREEVLDWVRTLRGEIAQGNRQMDARQRMVLQAALTNVENRMASTLSATVQTVEAKTDRSLSDLYATVNLQRERDVNAFNDRIDRVALNGETRSNQTDAILETLLQAAELRLK
jgi:hypothetical protein